MAAAMVENASSTSYSDPSNAASLRGGFLHQNASSMVVKKKPTLRRRQLSQLHGTAFEDATEDDDDNDHDDDDPDVPMAVTVTEEKAVVDVALSSSAPHAPPAPAPDHAGDMEESAPSSRGGYAVTPSVDDFMWLVLDYSTHHCLGRLSCCSKTLRAESQNTALWAQLVFRRWRLPARQSPRIYGGSSWPMVYQNMAHTSRVPRLRCVTGHTVFAKGRSVGDEVRCDCWCIVGHRADCRPQRRVDTGSRGSNSRNSSSTSTSTSTSSFGSASSSAISSTRSTSSIVAMAAAAGAAEDFAAGAPVLSNLIELRIIVQHTGPTGTLVVEPAATSVLITTLRSAQEITSQVSWGHGADAQTVLSQGRLGDVLLKEPLRVVRHGRHAPRLVSINDVKLGHYDDDHDADDPDDPDDPDEFDGASSCRFGSGGRGGGLGGGLGGGGVAAAKTGCFELSPLDVGVFSLFVECPAEFLYEPDFLTRADSIQVRVTRRPDRQLEQGCTKRIPLAFVDEGTVWDRYEQLPGGFMILVEKGGFGT